MLFRSVGGTCHAGELIAPGETCTIEVAMAPTVSGLLQSELEITDTAPGSPQSVELEGTATTGPAIDQPVPPQPIATRHAHVKRPCPKGKRKILKKGRRFCLKTRRHHRHSAHPAR